MPTVTLKFNLPEEREEYETTMKASDYASVLWDLDQTHLRGATKYDTIPTTVLQEIISDFSAGDYSVADPEMLELIKSERGQSLILSVLGGVRKLLGELTADRNCGQ